MVITFATYLIAYNDPFVDDHTARLSSVQVFDVTLFVTVR